METTTETPAKRIRPSPPPRVTPHQDRRARWFLGSGYTATRTADIVGIPAWYCEGIKAGGCFIGCLT